jgi:hypothetical protein
VLSGTAVFEELEGVIVEFQASETIALSSGRSSMQKDENVLRECCLGCRCG